MIGLIMNYRGVGKKGFSCRLQDFIKEFDLDFIGLQETLKKTIDSSVWRNFLIQANAIIGSGPPLWADLVASCVA